MAERNSIDPTADFRPEGAEVQDEERARAFAGEPPQSPEAAARGNLLAESLKDAFFAALIALVLAGPIVGLETTPIGAGLGLLPRWGDVAIIVAIVFVGRLLLNLFVWKTDRPVTGGIGKALSAIPAIPNLGRILSILLLIAAFALPFFIAFFFPSQVRRFLDLGTLIITYVMLGWGLNIVVGLAGLLDLGYVAFYAIGAYSFALLAEYFGLSFWICLPLAGILAAFWGVILGFPVLRLRGDYLAIVTLAFGEIIRLVLINWSDFTGGPVGISNIPRPSFFGIEFSRDPDGFAETFGLAYSPNHRIIYLYFIILVLALITNFVTTRVRRLPVGRAWEALREDEIACRSLGINTTTTKLTAFAMGGAFGGIAGSFFATRQGFISPESFNFLESATILAIVVLGGLGSQIGVAIAAIVMIGGIEMLRELTVLKAIFGPDFDPSNYRLLIFGLLMVVIMVWRPRGLVSTRQPTVHLRHRKAVSGAHVGEARMSAWLSDPVLSVEHLTMRFGGLVAINQLSFAAGRGEITALIGPNGAGKTTVFNCITGFYKPTEGRIAIALTPGALSGLAAVTAGPKATVNGQLYLLERMADHEIAKRARVARTFQNIRLFGGMTVLENLMVAQHNKLMAASAYTVGGLFGLAGYREGNKAAVEKASYWLDRVSLIDRADDAAADLPYGAQRRLEIARAMCTDPLLLCLDEPAAGLNPRESAELNELLRFICREHKISVLLIEHDMGVVMEISDHIVVLDYGEKISDGDTNFVRNDPSVIAAYLGVEDEEVEAVEKEVGV